jgi:hypothetical protein
MKGRRKVHKVMSEFKRGSLHSGSGGLVRSRAQAIAIALQEAGMAKKRKVKHAIRKRLKRY